jgi:hypothetical protein
MRPEKHTFIKLKSQLIAARCAAQEAAAMARRMDEIDLSERLRKLEDRLGLELDRVDGMKAG